MTSALAICEAAGLGSDANVQDEDALKVGGLAPLESAFKDSMRGIEIALEETGHHCA